MNFTIKNIEALNAVAEEIIQRTKMNTVFCFYGNLGTGKTTLIKLICDKLKVTDTISSPTYPIINEYHSPEGIIYHIDLYRLKSMDEALNIGLEEYLYSGNLCFIEWPDNFESILPEQHLKIKISKFEEDRTIVLSSN
ncbi:MAG: tRNA (adenosine(37)-N6)-threonylcarbamoyltransferase complex ATPase subunit type 1 TsaE [Chitinophagales bacterium]|mgnify:CR=1 FL=1